MTVISWRKKLSPTERVSRRESVASVLNNSPPQFTAELKNRGLNPRIVDIFADQTSEQRRLVPLPTLANRKRDLQSDTWRRIADESQNLFAERERRIESRFCETKSILAHAFVRVGESRRDHTLIQQPQSLQ